MGSPGKGVGEQVEQLKGVPHYCRCRLSEIAIAPVAVLLSPHGGEWLIAEREKRIKS